MLLAQIGNGPSRGVALSAQCGGDFLKGYSVSAAQHIDQHGLLVWATRRLGFGTVRVISRHVIITRTCRLGLGPDGGQPCVGDLERQSAAFVQYYNNERYHESLNNVTPADVYFGRAKSIIRERAKIKKQTIQKCRLQQQKQAA
jgi:hypothetical protein